MHHFGRESVHGRSVLRSRFLGGAKYDCEPGTTEGVGFGAGCPLGLTPILLLAADFGQGIKFMAI